MSAPNLLSKLKCQYTLTISLSCFAFLISAYESHYVFIYLSMIDQPKKQKEYANLLTSLSVEKLLTEDFVISKDHTKAETYPLSAFREAAERLGKVKKSELEIGRVWPKERFNGKEDSIILAEMIETIDQLLPIYQKLMEV